MVLLYLWTVLVPGVSFAATSTLTTPAPLPSYKDQLHQYCAVTQAVKQACHLRPGNDIQKCAEIALINSCKKNVVANKCDLLSEAEMSTDDLMDCRPQHLCDGQISARTLNCTIDGMKSTLTFATAAGFAGEAIAGVSGGLVATIPFLAYEAGEIGRSCDANTAFKRALIQLHNMALFSNEHPLILDTQPGDSQGPNASLLKQNCVELRKFLDRRLDVFVQRRTEAKAADPENKMPPLTANQRLLQSLHSNACYKEDVVLRRVCETITSVATGALLGIGVRAVAERTASHLFVY